MSGIIINNNMNNPSDPPIIINSLTIQNSVKPMFHGKDYHDKIQLSELKEEKVETKYNQNAIVESSSNTNADEQEKWLLMNLPFACIKSPWLRYKAWISANYSNKRKCISFVPFNRLLPGCTQIILSVTSVYLLLNLVIIGVITSLFAYDHRKFQK